MKKIKNLILSLLGLDSVSIDAMRKELSDLKTTISTLKDEATEISKKNELAFLIIKDLGVDRKGEMWWEEVDLDPRSEGYSLACKIRDGAKIKWVAEHASIKQKKVFHGGCINCITPLADGIGKCLGCQYMTADWSLPDLSRENEPSAR